MAGPDIQRPPESPVVSQRTPVPSDWEHAKILIGRTFRKDQKKPKLYFAKFFLVPILLMLYCLGFLINGEEGYLEPTTIAGGFELFEGTNWTYPQLIRLAGSVDDEILARVGDQLAEQFVLEGVESDVDVDTAVGNRTEFLNDCQATIAEAASEEVCIYLDTLDSYTIFYGGMENTSPFQSALAGTQWAMNSALLLAANVTYTAAPSELLFPVSQTQQSPQKIKESDSEPILIILLLPPIMQVLACAVTCQFMIGPITYEKVNQVSESFLFVGVKMRVYLFQWIGYYSMNLTITAVLLTVVSKYWDLMPMSDPSLVGISHYLGLVQMISFFTLLMQFIPQEETAQGMPFLFGLTSMGAGAGLLSAGWTTNALMYILSVFFPFVGMVQYYGIYINYDYAGRDTGIHWGDNVVESGLLGSMIAQSLGIILNLVLCSLYGSESFNDWLSGHYKHQQELDEQDASSAAAREQERTLSGDDFEPLPPGSDVVVRVRGVEHTYRPGRFDCDKSKKETEVLKGLDMDICRGEVFGYLGHNGAGKTTSVSILAHQIKMQRGRVSYHFRDGDYNLSDGKGIHVIRNKIGVCPQQNTALQDDLTARETLRLFAHLKGGIAQATGQSIPDAVEAEVERRLADVKFTTIGDSDKPVGTFSGGMKRKVLIAMSLLGDPEVVFLDEPTAGLDPYNRRSIWDMIVEAKQGRSIILTTHFLDEADVLSDRVGIIKGGSLITCGSSLFLKHAFGVGYTLTFDAPSPIAIDSLIPQAEALNSEQQTGTGYQWRLGHGTEKSFPETLKMLKSQGASNIQLNLTTLEQVFLETGKEDIEEENETDEFPDEGHGNNNASNDSRHENVRRDGDLLCRIWEPRCEIKPVGWWTKLYLIQNFMKVNAWKMKGSILLNIGMPLVYLIAGVTISAVAAPDLEGETITNDPVDITPWLFGDARFFGVPALDYFNPIQPLIPAEPPATIEDYYQVGELPFLGGYYEGNSTLQYASELTPFALQVATTVISNYSAWLNPNISIDGIATAVQQLPYIAESPFRIDLLFIPFCISFGFAGLAFSVLDVLLLKGDNSITIFRVSGITEWTTYLGVTAYKFTTTFLPFFVLLVVLGFSVGLTIFGNAGRWLGSILLMAAYGYSQTPMGLILAKRFIHSDFKSVANWFPGVYFTFVGLPYIVYQSILQAFPESEDIIVIAGDVLCIIPQVAFQRGLGAIMTVSSTADDDDLTWGEVWSFDARVWLTLLIMCVVGSLEWFYLYQLTTTRQAPTHLASVEEANDPHLNTPIDISEDPAMVEERDRSLVDLNGINATNVVKVFKVKDSSKGKKSSFVVKQSVKGISFGIRKNEILALLGPNGAGKTVTMSVLAGEITPEYGQIALNGVQIQTTDKSVDPLFRNGNVAYVPQFGALFSKQSVEEHLKFYARVRGLRWEDTTTEEHVNAIVKLLGLEKHREKQSGALSGGYKRRLSLAVALIGYPQAMMLDEVTTGMDPGARRLIWDVLKPKQAGAQQDSFDVPAILLSTHYMEESEALGDRIGIMINGRFAATGTLPQLYERYCTSFFVELSLEPSFLHDDASAGNMLSNMLSNDDDRQADQILDTFEQAGMPASIYEQLPYHLKLQVPFTEAPRGTDTTLQLARLFDLLETQKQALHIQFYSVAKMNLEQIFIDLSRQQFEADEIFESLR